MSAQQTPLTYEGVLEMFRETREQFRETREQFRETREQFQETRERMEKASQMIEELGKKQEATDRQIKRTSKEVGALGSRIGRIIENMVKGRIVDKFRALQYEITEYNPHKKFENKALNIRGEIDLFLENGDLAILVEVKTTLETKDVRDHILRIEKFRRHIDAKGNDKRRFIGAVAGAVVEGDAETLAHENGMYVIVQSGKAVEIVTPPEGFVAKEW